MFSTKKVNILLLTDIYKLGHIKQFPKNTTKVYSYLEARGSTELDGLIFFGLQYILKEYLTRKVTHSDVDDFIVVYKMAMHRDPDDFIVNKFRQLAEIGYLPVEIKALPEGTYIGLKHILMSITNTLPEFYWLPGYLEVILLKVWSMITTATRMFEYKKLAVYFWNKTVSKEKFCDYIYSVIDFGTRGNSSEESAGLHSMAFMTCFSGSDCFPVIEPSVKYYNVVVGDKNFMRTSPATEHSVMCAYGRDNELEAFRKIIEMYPDEPVCIVSDTYNLWNVFTTFLVELKPVIESRKYITAFRPDSGNPTLIVLGNPDAIEGSPEHTGCLQLLDKIFGHTLNERGFKVLNHVKIMYGDGITLKCYNEILTGCVNLGFSVENISFGVGSVMYKNTRDTLGFAFKAVAVTVNGEERHICKDPITDKSKKSKKGYIKLIKHSDGSFETIDGLNETDEKSTYLTTVYRNGKLIVDQSLYEIQERINLLFDTHFFDKIDGILCLMGNDCTGKTTLCKKLLEKFYSGESYILPMERSVKYNNVLFDELKKLVNPSGLDNILHMCAFENKPYIQSHVTYCSKVIKVYYMIVDAPVEVLKKRSSLRSEHDKYESEKAFRYYRNKYMEMSLYYGFPQILNDGTMEITDVANQSLNMILDYKFKQVLRIENINNLLKDYMNNASDYNDICEFYTRENDDIILCKPLFEDYTIIIASNMIEDNIENNCTAGLTYFECSLRGDLPIDKINYAFYVGTTYVNVQFEKGDVLPVVGALTRKYLQLKNSEIEECDEYDLNDLMDDLKDFFVKHPFEEYDLSDEHINEFVTVDV